MPSLCIPPLHPPYPFSPFLSFLSSPMYSLALFAGTVFMNRCDYLDPYLAWAGRRDSGKGASMGHLGFDAVTKPKSLHFKLNPNA